MKIRDFCRKEVVFVGLGTSVFEVANLMEAKNIGCVVITSGLKPMGLVTDRDILIRCFNRKLDPETPIDVIMTKDIFALDGDMTLYDALEAMNVKGMRRFPVIDNEGDLYGIITLDDVIGLLAKEMDNVSGIIEKNAPMLM